MSVAYVSAASKDQVREWLAGAAVSEFKSKSSRVEFSVEQTEFAPDITDHILADPGHFG